MFPISPDGLASNPWGNYCRITGLEQIRVTPEGWYRIIAATPEDFNSVSNDNTIQPPSPNYLVCQRSGERVTVEEGLVKEWTGLMVRRKYLDPRHPQELVRPPTEHSKGSPSPPITDRFIDDQYGTSGVQLSDLDP